MIFIIISVIGRGLKSGENFELLYKLAEKLNAAGKRK
jgi:electron transfer flavoprotein alpha subunit